MRLLTGFPGFLGTEFISRILKKTDARFLCLVQPKFMALAREKLHELNIRVPGALNRVQLIEGDMTLPGLGISDAQILSEVDWIYHFAAVYDLNVAEKLGKLVNVEGTRNVLNLATTLPKFKHFHYVSTCYVSGHYEGTFYEADLAKGQKFNNYYESTKYEAELLVREKMNAGFPATVYRPAIVVGDSRTGETQKFDGPYFVLQWLLRQGKVAILPQVGNPKNYSINLVPSNYVIDAMVFLSEHPDATGKTFQLADPHPLTIAEVIDAFARDCGKKIIQIPVPKALAKAAVGWIPGLESWLGIPRSALDYFSLPTSYDASETSRLLQGSGIECPRFDSYSKILVEYMKAHPQMRTKALT